MPRETGVSTSGESWALHAQAGEPERADAQAGGQIFPRAPEMFFLHEHREESAQESVSMHRERDTAHGWATGVGELTRGQGALTHSHTERNE